MVFRISQRLADEGQIYENIIEESQVRTHCCLPCIVQSYNAVKNTVECQPAIRERVVQEDGSIRFINYPLLINVPVVFPCVGSIGLKFPIKKNDEVLVVFSDLSIDNFWLYGSIQNPIELRRHDLSDGIAIPCTLSQTSQVAIQYGIEITNSDINLKAGTSTTTLKTIINTLANHEQRIDNFENSISDAIGAAY